VELLLHYYLLLHLLPLVFVRGVLTDSVPTRFLLRKRPGITWSALRAPNGCRDGNDCLCRMVRCTSSNVKEDLV
jgi:hypothetical protein